MARALKGEAGSPEDRAARWRRRVAHETRRELAVTTLLSFLALASLVGGSAFGDVHAPSIDPRLIAWTASPALVVFGTLLTRRLARHLGQFVGEQTVPSAGAAVRIIVAAVGYVLVLFGVFDILSVSVARLLVGGALTGVIVGIAAQQSLGNVFAGLVLLAARPFGIGDHIRIRSGALGGQLEGIVLGMSLTYVTIHVDGGPLKIPNSGMLAAAVGPSPVGPKLVPQPEPAPASLPQPDPSAAGQGPDPSLG